MHQLGALTRAHTLVREALGGNLIVGYDFRIRRRNRNLTPSIRANSRLVGKAATVNVPVVHTPRTAGELATLDSGAKSVHLDAIDKGNKAEKNEKVLEGAAHFLRRGCWGK